MEKKAVSPDSSTQLAEKSKSSKKRKHKHRNKSKKSKKFKSSSSSVDIESDNTRTGSKTNKASNESIKHLTEFLDDRKELHAQLFSIIPKKEVKEMMPNILKKLSFKEVKKLCSEQLELISKRHLESIITGKEMASSDDESMDEQEKLDELQPVEAFPQRQERKRKQDRDGNRKEKKGKEQEKKEKDMIIFQEMITIPNQEEIDELVEGSSATQEQTTEDTAQSSAVTVDEEAELKELEFRARALESLVRARERQMKNEQA